MNGRDYLMAINNISVSSPSLRDPVTAQSFDVVYNGVAGILGADIKARNVAEDANVTAVWATDSFKYVITLTNSGTTPITDAVLTDGKTNHISYGTAVITQGTGTVDVNNTASSVKVTITALAAGETAIIKIPATATEAE